ncbi:MAG: rhomboid family intramembrane serine protease [Cytophagaceae bacterium]|nr:MAG: rhomboid family intramembrane serine protease [Cytophagaceae bacterium]
MIKAGSVPFLIVYFAGGLFGNILGGNFSRVGIPSVGASGALVAIVSPFYSASWFRLMI